MEIKQINKKLKELEEEKRRIKRESRKNGEKNFYDKIANNIVELRKKNDLSMTDFIEKTGLGISKAAYWGIENKRQKISLYQIYLIALTFGVSIEDIMDRKWGVRVDEVKINNI